VKLTQILLFGLVCALAASFATWRISQNGPPPPATTLPLPPPISLPAAPAVSTLELDRLTSENADLASQLADARARLTERDATLTTTRARLDELRRPMNADILSSTLRAELKSGEIVVTGGYKLPDGSRLYAFATPVLKTVDGARVITVESRFMAITDDAGKAVGLDNLSTNAANTLQHGEVWVPDEAAAVLQTLQTANGITMMATSPSLSVKPDSSGEIEVEGMHLKFTPTVLPDGETLDFEVRLDQPQVVRPPPVETSKAPVIPEEP